MPVSSLTLVERIARVLAGRDVSINADGDDPSAGPNVDDARHAPVADALSIPRTMPAPARPRRQHQGGRWRSLGRPKGPRRMARLCRRRFVEPAPDARAGPRDGT